MDITNERVVGINHLSILDSLNAPCLSFSLFHHEMNEPTENKIIIKVGKNENDVGPKQVVFEISRPLLFFSETSDQFILESNIQQNRVTMCAKIVRRVNETGDALLEQEVIEEIPYQTITLFEGENYITTNLNHVTLEMIYPKNTEFNRNYLNVALYHEQLTDTSCTDLYFKDAFTKTTDGINIDVNNLNINCLTSNHNHFHLDSEGNLTVKTLTVEESVGGNIDYNEILNLVYPIGSIYMSVNASDPGTIFGGTWVNFATGKTLVGVDTEQSEFNEVEKTGGEKAHKLTVQEMPEHNHNIIIKADWNYKVGVGTGGTFMNAQSNYGWNGSLPFVTENSGNNQPHNNLQPYITCYIWKRVS